MSPKLRWFKWNMIGLLGGAMVFQTSCLTEKGVEAVITASITSAIQVIVNSVFFGIDAFLVSVS